MEATRDRTWRDHMKSGQILEEGKLGQFRMVLLKVTKQSSFVNYHYRMIFFLDGGREPVLSLNLESTSGDAFLGAHIGDVHENHGDGDLHMSIQDFREWALATAKHYLSPGNSTTPDVIARTSIDDGVPIELSEPRSRFFDPLGTSTLLANRMKEERDPWFRLCCRLLQDAQEHLNTGKSIDLDMKLEGGAERIVKAFQFVHILGFISDRQYVDDDDFFELTRLLIARTFLRDWENCKAHVGRYSSLKKKYTGDRFPEQFLKFSEDLASEIIGPSGGMISAPAIDATMVVFYWRNLLVAAEAFGDEESKDSLLRDIERFRSSNL